MDREVKPYVLRRSPKEGRARTLSVGYAQALNPQQLAAVTAPDGPALVIAGAGSGKTRTLVYRVAYLIDSGVDPEAILLLTFTRRAAREMLKRVGLLIGGRGERVAGGTFRAVPNVLGDLRHGFVARILTGDPATLYVGKHQGQNAGHRKPQGQAL